MNLYSNTNKNTLQTMKRNHFNLKIIGILTFAAMVMGCHDPSSIKIKNNLSKAVIQNVEWGEVPVSSQILPGETSAKIKIYHNNYYDVDLPEKHQIKFYINVNGDKVYLETKERYKLDTDENITIEINDSTEVINPLLESEKQQNK